MDMNAQNQPEEQGVNEPQSMPTWHAPAITHIDIKRTLLDAGSFSDGSFFTLG